MVGRVIEYDTAIVAPLSVIPKEACPCGSDIGTNHKMSFKEAVRVIMEEDGPLLKRLADL